MFAQSLLHSRWSMLLLHLPHSESVVADNGVIRQPHIGLRSSAVLVL
jgi:hypothetical protein